MEQGFNGLSSAEVKNKKSLGLSNEVIDSYNSRYLQIFLRNIFNLINIVLAPLLLALAYFHLYIEILAFALFLIINTIVSIIDEVRVKKKLDNLKSEFQITTTVIRDGKEMKIPVSEIVQGDYVKAKEGDGLIADGEIVYENYLQVDESILTGESNYLRKDKGEKVLSGSYVVTGECIYIVESVGKNNYLNKLAIEAVKVKEKKSPVQQSADKIILFLIFASLTAGILNVYFVIQNGVSYENAVLSITAIIALIIPQTLIFLFTLTYTISITKLYNKGILVQKGGSIEELSNVNVICFDKTGTITNNKMRFKNAKYFNLDENIFGNFYNSISEKLVGVNETQRLINNKFSENKKFEIDNFDQIPFTSKQKYSLVKAESNGVTKVIVLGAFSALSNTIDKKLVSNIERYIKGEESKGFRVLTGLYKEFKGDFDIKNPLNFSTENIVVFTIEETLNPGVKDILDRLKDQEIDVKIISGDSKTSVTRICQKIGIDSDQIVDLSEGEIDEETFADLVVSKTVFTRAKPEDKLRIINILKEKGFKTAMVGDGINDVLGLKAANVSISMESGAKVTREVSDIVLLKNDYTKIPDIFFEGDNIIFNLKLSTKIFLVKSLFALMISFFYTFRGEVLPLHPSSTLIFSFLGSSAPSYVLIFTRQKVEDATGFFKDVLRSVIPTAFVFAILFIILHQLFLFENFDFLNANTSLFLFVLSISIIYSLYLVWEAKKIKSIFLAGFVFFMLMIVGIYQTLLPININDPIKSNILLLTPMFIGGFLLLFTFMRSLKSKKWIIRFAASVLSFVWIPIALIFPFDTYYNVTRIPFEIYIRIGFYSVVGLLLIILVNVISKRIFK